MVKRAKRQSRDPQEKDFMIAARIERRTTVYLKARDAAHAAEKFQGGDWESEDTGEVINWEAVETPKENA